VWGFGDVPCGDQDIEIAGEDVHVAGLGVALDPAVSIAVAVTREGPAGGTADSEPLIIIWVIGGQLGPGRIQSYVIDIDYAVASGIAPQVADAECDLLDVAEVNSALSEFT